METHEGVEGEPESAKATEPLEDLEPGAEDSVKIAGAKPPPLPPLPPPPHDIIG